MATKNITDYQVCTAYVAAKLKGVWPYEILQKETGEPFKVCWRAMERAVGRGLIDYGVSLRTGWITSRGICLISANTSFQGTPHSTGKAD